MVRALDLAVDWKVYGCRMTRCVVVLTGVLALAPAIARGQHHPPTAGAMGFDQNAIAHHFLLKSNGGAIEIAVRDRSDRQTLNAVRSHLRQIAAQFGAGNFEAPFATHGEAPPGAAALQRLKSSVRYVYAQTGSGGRVDISTRNAEALAAVHEFLRY